MAEAKPFASLSSGLLARKGAAKPAMRPQGYGFSTMTATPEDLGWNDMGYDPRAEPDAAAPTRLPIHLTPAPAESHAPVTSPDVPLPAPDVPPVVTQQQDLARELGAVTEEDQAPVAIRPMAVPVVAIRRAKEAAAVRRGKAAFTLRLDAERHLRLRLACALDNRSAQQLVTRALDEFLANKPELDVLAGQLPARSVGSND